MAAPSTATKEAMLMIEPPARFRGGDAVLATEERLIQDGQRIRLHGTHGYVEILA